LTEAAPPLAVYIHWPYCARICPYCDFNVVRERGRTVQQGALVDAIAADLELQAAAIGPRRLTSIFFGGGTPSLMQPDWAGRLIETARRLWAADGPVEVSLEANPTDAEAGRFAGLAQAGVQRLSLGVQSFDDEALKFLGRNHDSAQAQRALETALATFPRVSLDLIYALPGQTPEAWAAELARAAASGVEHISPYQLTIEVGTAFGRQVERGEFTPVDAEAGAQFYETTQAVLQAAGFEAYEVSNHARGEAARSVHNLAYWRGWDYVGAGPGAHGRLTIAGRRLATLAEPKIEAYIAAAGRGLMGGEPLSAEDVAVERVLMGLRTVEGVALADLAPLSLSRLPDLLAQQLVRAQGDRVFATSAGRAVLDRVAAELAA
jgi:putative oxygen-independent coproporphyrinogen III oxidase